MKCIRHIESSKIVRVLGALAAELVASGQFKYTTKGAWRSFKRNGG